MNQQALLKQATELLRFYQVQYKEYHGRPPLVNMHKDKWSARDLVESFGLDRCKAGVLWYFKVRTAHDWQTFANGCHNYIAESEAVAADKAKRAAQRRAANEWRNS